MMLENSENSAKSFWSLSLYFLAHSRFFRIDCDKFISSSAWGFFILADLFDVYIFASIYLNISLIFTGYVGVIYGSTNW